MALVRNCGPVLVCVCGGVALSFCDLHPDWILAFSALVALISLNFATSIWLDFGKKLRRQEANKKPRLRCGGATAWLPLWCLSRESL